MCFPVHYIHIYLRDMSLSLPGSPLGPDAYHEYQILLVQDYEELKKKNNQNSIHKNNNKPKENPIFEDEGWLQLTPVKLIPLNPNLFSSSKDTYDGGPKLMAYVYHFPLILCPFFTKVVCATI